MYSYDYPIPKERFKWYLISATPEIVIGSRR
jgi:hypothetical protein